MPLNLVHGPPNSGRAGLIRRRFSAALDRDPVLVVPTVDDVYSFERELCEGGAALGGTTMTLGGLFREVVVAAGSPPPEVLSPAQRLRVVSLAVADRRNRLGPLRRSTARPGFAAAFERLLDELQAAGREPADVEAAAATLEGSAYLGDVATLFAAYAARRDALGRMDAHGVARQAIELLRDSGGLWCRPIFLYGLDDLTAHQLELIGLLARTSEVTVALPYEEGNTALAARASLLEALRATGPAAEIETHADPGNTASPLLFHLERGYGSRAPGRREPDSSLVVLRSAGARGEAESIGAEVARLIAGGADPNEIAIVLRDPARRGPLIASVLESYGVATALEAELPVASTAVGGTMLALLAAVLGEGSAGDVLRYLRGPSGLPAGQVDWFERAMRRRRIRSAAAALELWEERHDQLPYDVARIREAMGDPPALAAAVGRLAATIASRPLRSEQDGPRPGPGEGLELRAAAAISAALADLADPEDLAPAAAELGPTIAQLRLRVWSGPVEGRVRIASPYRLRAARFDHVFVGSLQDGEFPRRERGGDPFLSDAQRATLELEPRRESDTEEHYLFHACLALPRRSLFLSWRDSDENGAAEARSPLLDEVLRLLQPAAGEDGAAALEAGLTRVRDLTRVTHRVAEAPSEDELARAIAVRGPSAGGAALLAAAAPPPEAAERVATRLAKARAVEAATRAPGPLANPAVIESLASVRAYGGTTLEGFDLCSYRWFVAHELDPQPLDPVPDPLIQGGLMHAVLERLYAERPGGEALPGMASLRSWIQRGRELLAEEATARELGADPAERAIVRRVEGLLERFLAEEASRSPSSFQPWLLEARFGDEEGGERPSLEIDGWGLHGAVDRVDRDGRGRALVIDYKLSGQVTAREKLEEEAKLQLQLYLIAVAELWGEEPVAGLYHPLRGTSSRRPRGVVLDEALAKLDGYGLSRTDVVDREGFEAMLDDARRRAGAIVARMRRGDIRRDPGPRRGLRGHGLCPPFCDFAPICRRDRAPVEPREEEGEEG
ncbi:MAG TPA: PD-(D/E)XK nuclease family protein [Solirubrobacterales bacterium]|jgi:RecB family exonuclease|nr:PD-(D/E)XK nuclease family protein [Solirubrobacterales bacterium]